MVQYDEKDSIGKRYRRQDAIGTPYSLTIDHDSLKKLCYRESRLYDSGNELTFPN